MEQAARELLAVRERERATREILQVINRSPGDYQPVFDAILESAARLCDAPLGLLLLRRDDGFEFVSQRGARAETIEYLRRHPLPLDPQQSVTARAALERRPIQIRDVADEPLYRAGQHHRRVGVEVEGIRTQLSVPLVRDGEALGILIVYRREVREFQPEHVELLSTFAEQAVIAIENVRRFRALEARTAELGVALERQSATSEILRAISRSPSDYQPIFETILRNAMRLCAAPLGTLFLLREEGFQAVETLGARPEFLAFLRDACYPADGNTVVGRTALERRPVQVEDIAADAGYQRRNPLRVASVELEGIRTLLAVPLLKNDQVMGAIALYRREVRPFSGDHVALVETFADQALIAIENVRLFQTLQARTGELSELLERQTATSEILRAISRSRNDYQPVFETILDNALRLCHAPLGLMTLARDGHLHVVVSRGASPEFVEFIRANPFPLDRSHGITARAATEQVPVQCADLAAEPRAGDRHRSSGVEKEGIRTLLAVPMLQGDTTVGVLGLYRREVKPFNDGEVELVSTFADQAVIAIENVRLFQAVESRSRALARSVAELEALGEVAQAVSSTLDLETVLETVITRAVELSGCDTGAIHELDEATGTLPPRAAPGFEELLELPAPRLGEGAVGRAASTRAPVQIDDVAVPGAYTGPLLDRLAQWRIRALLAVPMIQDERVIGTLLLARRTPGEFPPETVRLLRALGAQSAVAIRNARLFRELEDKSRQLETANRHKTEFLANMSHELRTPLNAIIGFSEVLTERMFGELNDKQAEYVGDIHDSGRHLLSLINDILDLSKIEAGAMELDLRRFALAPALDNALTLVKERAGRRGIALKARLVADLGEMVGDERKLKQILLNLLSNAIKFTGEGGNVTLQAHRDDTHVHIAVRDTGVGISKQDQGVVFEEFRQVGSDPARKVEGTGLGLTLTRRFVELHGGSIAVDSEPGVGSTFTVSLPLRPPEPAP